MLSVKAISNFEEINAKERVECNEQMSICFTLFKNIPVQSKLWKCRSGSHQT